MAPVRPYSPEDKEFILGLAPRLTIGMPPWRDRDAVVATIRKWIGESIDRLGERAAIFVAIGPTGQRLGFATVSEQPHYTGEVQAYLGELAVVDSAEGTGVGRSLIRSCESWARGRGLRIVALSTGAANVRALGFYRHLGFADEDVKLIKLL